MYAAFLGTPGSDFRHRWSAGGGEEWHAETSLWGCRTSSASGAAEGRRPISRPHALSANRTPWRRSAAAPHPWSGRAERRRHTSVFDRAKGTETMVDLRCGGGSEPSRIQSGRPKSETPRCAGEPRRARAGLVPGAGRCPKYRPGVDGVSNTVRPRVPLVRPVTDVRFR